MTKEQLAKLFEAVGLLNSMVASTAPTEVAARDADEPHRWAIEPNPDTDYDTLITNSDEEAIYWIHEIAESHLWDTNEGGDRIMNVSLNPAIPSEPPPAWLIQQQLNDSAAIDTAVLAERERCAGIAKAAFDRLDLLNTEDAGVMRQVWAAIREGKS